MSVSIECPTFISFLEQKLFCLPNTNEPMPFNNFTIRSIMSTIIQSYNLFLESICISFLLRTKLHWHYFINWKQHMHCHFYNHEMTNKNLCHHLEALKSYSKPSVSTLSVIKIHMF
ncbi:unnamed protein product [Prunus brigantina]